MWGEAQEQFSLLCYANMCSSDVCSSKTVPYMSLTVLIVTLSDFVEALFAELLNKTSIKQMCIQTEIK